MSETIFDMLPDGGREAKQSVAGAGAVVGSSLFLANKIKEKLDE